MQRKETMMHHMELLMKRSRGLPPALFGTCLYLAMFALTAFPGNASAREDQAARAGLAEQLRSLDGKVFPVFVNPMATGYLDELGHGTHVTGIINGRDDNDQYIGIAPDARVISVKLSRLTGSSWPRKALM